MIHHYNRKHSHASQSSLCQSVLSELSLSSSSEKKYEDPIIRQEEERLFQEVNSLNPGVPMINAEKTGPNEDNHENYFNYFESNQTITYKLDRLNTNYKTY